MSIQPPGQPPQFQVVGITPGQYQTDAAGNAVQGRIVHFRLADGTTDQVFIPDTQWSPATAQALIEQAVTDTHAIRSLGNMP